IFEKFVSDFQDRTFKNADPEQVYGALLKYTRTGGAQSKAEATDGVALSDEQKKLLKMVLSRHATGGKVLPYSDGFTNARNDFKKTAGMELTEFEFWRAVIKTAGVKRKPPPPRKRATQAD